MRKVVANPHDARIATAKRQPKLALEQADLMLVESVASRLLAHAAPGWSPTQVVGKDCRRRLTEYRVGRVVADRDHVDIVDGAARLGEAPFDGPDRRCGRRVLDAAEPFLLDHSDQLSVDEDRCGIVVADRIGDT